MVLRCSPWILLIAAVACGGDDGGVTARFELPAEGMDFYALPFPSDLRRDDDGTISLAGHPRPNDLTSDYLDVIDQTVTGFALSPVGLFLFDGAIDTSSLPSDPDASRQESASVYLVDLEPSSPDYGQRVPVRVRFEESAGSVISDNWLAVQTYPGFVLREEQTYAFVVTRRVTAGGEPIERASVFDDLIAGRGDSEAVAVHAPLLAYLEESGGDDVDDVVSAAVFTTQDISSLLLGAREVVRAEEQPVARDVSLVSENGTFARYDGAWDAPNFQVGDPPYRREGGSIEVDAAGLPIVQRSEELRFAMSVPVGQAPPSGWPVVLYAHGTGGSYTSFIGNGTAQRLAEQGIAGLSMDQVLHGPRDPGGGSPELNFFNFLNPSSARDNTLQGAIDLLNLTRLAEGMSHDDQANGRVVTFDDSRLMFFGHSQGGITGMPYLAVEPTVGAAVLSGSGGLLYLALLLKTEPVDIASLIATVIRDEPLDEFNPVLALLQTYLARADGVNYARQVISEPLPGAAAKDVLLGEGFVDRFTPRPSIEALAVALGVELAGPVIEPIEGLGLAGRETLSLPVSGNLDGGTGVVVQYNEAAGSDGHFIFFDVPGAVTQAVEFLASHAADGQATLVAP